MKTMIIKWDESMIQRCLAKCPTAVLQSKEKSREPVPKSAEEIQWDEFKRALNKALERR